MEGKKGNPGAKHPENTSSGSTANPTGANQPEQPNSIFFLPVFQVIKENGSLSKQFSKLRKQLNGLSRTEVFVAVHKFFDEKMEKTFKNKLQQKSIKKTRTTVEQEFAKLGLCCGQFLKVIAAGCLVCCADETGCNNIKPGVTFYEFEDVARKSGACICQAHFATIADPVVFNDYRIPKTDFKKAEYKSVEEVPIEKCEICSKQLHEPCRCVKLYQKEANFFCHRENDAILNVDDTSMEKIELTPLAEFIQQTLATKNPAFEGILVREVYSKKTNFFSSSDAKIIREKFRKFNFELTDYSYRKRMFVVSQKKNGVDTIFLVQLVTEFPQLKWCTLDFLDSVPYVDPFLPEEQRRNFYHTILLAYASYAGSVGYKHMFFHAAPPTNEQTYLFKFKQARRPRTYEETRDELMKFYLNMLGYGIKEGMIDKYYRSVQLNLENQSIPEIFNSIAFASHFQNQIEDGLDKYDSEGLQFDLQQYKKELVETLNDDARNSASFFYIILKTRLDEIDEKNEKTIRTPICKSRQTWMSAQFIRKWEFTSLEQAKYASLRCIKAIVTKDECENTVDKLGDWNHEDLTNKTSRFPFKGLLHRSKTNASDVLQSASDTANKVPVKDANVVEAAVAKTHAADTGAPATAIVGQPPVPQRRYRFEVNNSCVVRYLGRGWNGCITKVGTKKKGVRGYRVAFKCFAFNLVIFVPFDDEDKQLFKNRSEYDSFFKRPVELEEQVTTAPSMRQPTSLNQLQSQAAKQKRLPSGKETEVPSEATPVSTGNQNRLKRQHTDNLRPHSKSNGRQETPAEGETPTRSQEKPVEQSPKAKKKSKHN